METIEVATPSSKASSPSAIGLVIQTIFVTILYVALVSAVDLGSTLIGGMMLEYGDGNTALPLHSLHLVAFRGYWIALAIAFAAALGRKWARFLSGDVDGKGDYEWFEFAAGTGSLVAMVLAIVCLVGYAAGYDWFAGVTGCSSSPADNVTFFIWATVMSIVTFFEWKASQKIAEILSGDSLPFELHSVISWAISPVIALVISALGLAAVVCVLGLIAGAILVSVGVPLVLGLIVAGFLLGR